MSNEKLEIILGTPQATLMLLILFSKHPYAFTTVKMHTVMIPEL